MPAESCGEPGVPAGSTEKGTNWRQEKEPRGFLRPEQRCAADKAGAPLGGAGETRTRPRISEESRGPEGKHPSPPSPSAQPLGAGQGLLH